ncbi:MAG: DNRLRE domain-containing protein [Veillonella sp.]|nr:DNRLRE domain-containing protein [Veillonella sp.]
MSHADLKLDYGTYVDEGYPDARIFRRHTYAKVTGTKGHRCWTILWFAMPFPTAGANVSKATLSLRMKKNNNNTHKLTAELAGPWSRSFWSLDWNHKPAGAGHRTDTTRDGIFVDGGMWQIDVTDAMQAVADGAPFYGLLLWSDMGGDSLVFDVQGDKRPSLSVDWWTNPFPPADLEPGPGGVTGTPTPMLRWTFYDHVGDTDMAACQVQAARSEDGFSEPVWDSGVRRKFVTQFDLASEADGFPRPGDGESLWWRVRIQDGSGLWSGWSAPARYTYKPRPTVELLNPDPGEQVVTDPTPPISWRYTPGGGGPEDHWRVVISRWAAGRWHQVATSGVVSSGATSWRPTTPVRIGGTYQVVVDVWDSETHRVATPGYGILARANTTFTYIPTSQTPTPTQVDARTWRNSPWAALQWSRPDMPDEWIISVDGRQVERRSQAPDGGASYTASVLVPSGPHTVQVQAVGDRGASQPLEKQIDRDLLATWLVDRETREAVALVSDTSHEITMPEVTASHEPLGSQRSIVVTSAQRGYEGTLSGTLVPLPGVAQTPPQWRARLLEWKPQSGRLFDLVIEDYVLPVNISNVQVTSVNGHAGRLFNCSFDFHQVGDFTFAGDVL